GGGAAAVGCVAVAAGRAGEGIGHGRREHAVDRIGAGQARTRGRARRGEPVTGALRAGPAAALARRVGPAAPAVVGAGVAGGRGGDLGAHAERAVEAVVGAVAADAGVSGRRAGEVVRACAGVDHDALARARVAAVAVLGAG